MMTSEPHPAIQTYLSHVFLNMIKHHSSDSALINSEWILYLGSTSDINFKMDFYQ